MELDPTFRKALKLLHSRSEDATEQLRQIMEDAIAQKRAAVLKERAPMSPKVESNDAGKIHVKKGSPREDGAAGSSSDGRKKEAEKRTFEKVVSGGDSPGGGSDAKIMKMSDPDYSCDVPLPCSLKSEPLRVRKTDADSDSSDGNADEFAMEMGLACIICKQIEVSHGNQLIECQECHSLFHQECHKPPAHGYDVNDPRSVWYCARCTKNMKKLASKTQKTTKTSNSVMCKDSVNPSRNVKSENVAQAVLLPFKRTELKAPSSQGSSTSATNKPIGLAGLAANLSGRSATTSASSSLSSSSTSSSSSTRPVSSKTVIASPKSKTIGPFTALYPSTKNVAQVNSSSSSKIQSTATSTTAKASNSNNYAVQTTSAISVSAAAKGNNSPSNSTSKSSASTLSSVISASSRAGSSNNGNSGGMAAGGAKPASSSSLMSADKRLQIMKKKAAKMQEKRRLSSK